MSRIQIRRNHDLGKERAREAAEGIASELRQQLQADYRWDGDDLHFERSGAQGHIRVGDDAVEVEVKLGLRFTPMRSMIERRIEAYLAERLG